MEDTTELIQEKIDYILNIQKDISQVCSDETLLFQTINNLKNDKKYLNEIAEELYGEYPKNSKNNKTKNTGTLKFLQMTIVQMLLKGENIDKNAIEKIKSSYVNDKKFFNNYFKGEKYNKILQDMNDYSKSNPFANWKNLANILRRLLYCKEEFSKVKTYLKNISSNIISDCEFDKNSLTQNTNGFLENQGYGRDVPVIVLYDKRFNNQKNAIQICLCFQNNVIETYIQSGKNDNYSLNDLISETKEYQQLIDDIKNSKDDFIKQTNNRLNHRDDTSDKQQIGDDKPMHKNIPLNQILYGPPGTGKTYNTVVKAMEIIGLPEEKPAYITVDENDQYNYANLVTNINKAQKGEQQEYSDTEYKVLKQAFDEAKNNHQIEFITFHQSYSYEEFVEGIKPYIPKDNCEQDKTEKKKENTKKGINTANDIQYEIKKGVFRQIVENAKNAPKIANKISFDEACTIFKEKYPQGSIFDKLLSLNYENDKISYNYGKSKRNNTQSIPLKELKTFYNNNDIFKNQTDLQKKIGKKIKLGTYNLLFYNELLRIKNEQNTTKKSYVLIIDEINRGNISKIFGELITLIEEDKRAGGNNTITVTLPYSQEPFSVPKNLFIIGTMNTSDRSIASIDIALRRRFKFVEMMPNEELVADFGCNFKEVLKKLNRRISALLDRDHQIGHSYFIKEKYENANIETLKDIWFDSVMPLLNEYFYGDWEKLQAILGKAKNKNGSSLIEEFDTEKLFASENNPCDKEPYYDFRAKSNYYSDSGTENFINAMKNAFDEFGKPQESQEKQEQKETQEINNNNTESQ